jgi:hypothetical protein
MQTSLIRVARAGVSAARRGAPVAVVAMLRSSGGAARRRWLLLAAVVVVGAGFLVAGALAQFPITVADTATAWIFGGRGGDGQPQVPAICAAPPTPTAAQVVDNASTGPGPEETAPAPGPPPPALDADGRPTPEAQAVMERIPAGADVTVAQGWILFGLAHPNDTSMDFALFAQRFEQTAGMLSAQATALDTVTTMDPAADYSPYLLFSQAGAYQMMRQGSVSATAEQRDELIEAVGVTCESRAR